MIRKDWELIGNFLPINFFRGTFEKCEHNICLGFHWKQQKRSICLSKQRRVVHIFRMM